MQRANEERKLNHRLGVADKLEQLAERNGNPNLLDTAARKREKAWQLYEKRLAKIDSKDPSLLPPEEDGLLPDDGDLVGDDDLVQGDPALADDLVDSLRDGRVEELARAVEQAVAPTDGIPQTDDPLTSLDNLLAEGQKLTGRENALFRQLRNEHRKLTRRMEAAEQLWEAYEQIGDEQLADAARALEERALSHFEKRMIAIEDFQQRHGLQDVFDFDLGLPTVE